MWLLCCGHYYCGYYGMEVYHHTTYTDLSFLIMPGGYIKKAGEEKATTCLSLSLTFIHYVLLG